MENWKTWLFVIVAFFLIRQCGGCGGSGGLDLSKTNKLVLQPYDGCDFSELTLILYADGTLHAEGVWAASGKSFSQDYEKWSYERRSFHDTVYEGIDFSIENGRVTKDGYRNSTLTYGISPNLELLWPGVTDPQARPIGKFRKK